MTIKQERVQDLIQERLSYLLQNEVTDPALKNVTITDVKVDREIEYADVFVSAMGDDSREKEVMQGLKRASGFLRRETAARLRLRRMPQFHFHWDRVLASAEHIEELLDSIKHENKPTTNGE